MYVRIARFEGGDPDEMDAEAALLRDALAALERGDETSEVPARLAEVSSRLELFADRERRTVIVCVYSATEADVREADKILSAMSPGSKGWGKRVSAEFFEVLLSGVTAVGRAELVALLKS